MRCRAERKSYMGTRSRGESFAVGGTDVQHGSSAIAGGDTFVQHGGNAGGDTFVQHNDASAAGETMVQRGTVHATPGGRRPPPPLQTVRAGLQSLLYGQTAHGHQQTTYPVWLAQGAALFRITLPALA